MAMMVACGAWGESQPPAPSAAKHTAPEQAHSAQANEKSASDKNSPPVAPISIIVSPTISAQPAASDQRKDGNDKAPPKDWVEIIGSAVTVIATIVIAIFTWRLSDSTKSLWEETREAGKTAKELLKRLAPW